MVDKTGGLMNGVLSESFQKVFSKPGVKCCRLFALLQQARYYHA